MSSINYDLTQIKAFVFDIDGVLSPSTINLDHEGNPIRMFNVKDRYAIRKAIEEDFLVSIISAANTDSVRNFFFGLGIKHLYLSSSNKKDDLLDFASKNKLTLNEVAYSGDDIPDLEAMKIAGLSIAPNDAATDILDVAKYISRRKGGEGIARDVIEQTLRSQNKW